MKIIPRDIKADLPVMQNMVLVRSLQDLQQMLGSKSASDAELLEEKAASKSKKTKFNIPITDVTIDKDYETNLRAIYTMPTSYVRYVRKIGDEADIATDYNLELEDKKWIAAHPVLGSDKDAKKYLTSDTFEAIIDILERHSGYSKEVVPLPHAQQLVAEKLRWDPQISAKLLPLVYQYWLKKRETLKKPLCRKYWPQTPAADNNPHLTFRPRDKEKYRLRKQHRKNDLDAFRKMQQLRREFGRAYDLLCLLVERESLREAELEINKEIFEQTLWDINHARVTTPTGKASHKPPPARRAIQYSHSLRYEELLKESELPPAAIALDEAVFSSLQARHAPAAGAGGLAAGGSHTGPSRERSSQESEARKAARRAQQAAQQLQNAQRKRLASDAPTDVASAPTTQPAGLIPTHLRSIEQAALQQLHPLLPGPRTACRPAWPHFLEDNPWREPWAPPTTLSQYLDDLNLAQQIAVDDADQRGLRALHRGYVAVGLERQGGDSGGGMLGAYRTTDSTVVGENSSQPTDAATIIPSKPSAIVSPDVTYTYRVRGRVGRGGRLVLDRIPVRVVHPPSSHASDIGLAKVGNTSNAPQDEQHMPATVKEPQSFEVQFQQAAVRAAQDYTHETYRKQSHIYGEQLAQETSPAMDYMWGSVTSNTVRYLQSSSISGNVTNKQSATATAGAALPAPPVPPKLNILNHAVPATVPARVPPTAPLAIPPQPSVPASTTIKPLLARNELYIVPPTHPLERPIVQSSMLARQADIYACSDSEDEVVEIYSSTVQRPSMHGNTAAAGETASTGLKYHIRI